jgi:hypothetical protein
MSSLSGRSFLVVKMLSLSSVPFSENMITEMPGCRRGCEQATCSICLCLAVLKLLQVVRAASMCRVLGLRHVGCTCSLCHAVMHTGPTAHARIAAALGRGAVLRHSSYKGGLQSQ